MSHNAQGCQNKNIEDSMLIIHIDVTQMHKSTKSVVSTKITSGVIDINGKEQIWLPYVEYLWYVSNIWHATYVTWTDIYTKFDTSAVKTVACRKQCTQTPDDDYIGCIFPNLPKIVKIYCCFKHIFYFIQITFQNLIFLPTSSTESWLLFILQELFTLNRWMCVIFICKYIHLN